MQRQDLLMQLPVAQQPIQRLERRVPPQRTGPTAGQVGQGQSAPLHQGLHCLQQDPAAGGMHGSSTDDKQRSKLPVARMARHSGFDTRRKNRVVHVLFLPALTCNHLIEKIILWGDIRS
jgi:hypothetical protein